MRPRRALAAVAAVVALAAPLVAPQAALAVAKLPKPGTATQIASLVAASTSIESLPRGVVPPLVDVASDNPGAYYPSANRKCLTLTKCVFGERMSSHAIVLFGDSHAQMWLPALAPVAKSLGYRLVLVWEPGCPAATVSVWDMPIHAINGQCNSWRTQTIKAINKLKPRLVLLASRTSDIPGPQNHPTTDAAWQLGLEQTITALKTTATTVAVVGDITVFSPNNIPACLAAYPGSIQQCSVRNPNGGTRQHFAAEQAAATAEKVAYINPQPWLCTMPSTTTPVTPGECSPVIGKMVAYFDTFHVSATYAEYLSSVWKTAIEGVLPL